MQNNSYYFLLPVFFSLTTTTLANNTQFFTDLVKKDLHNNASQNPLQIELTLFKKPNFFIPEPELHLTIIGQTTETIPDQPRSFIKLIGPTNTPTFINYNLIWPYHPTEIGYNIPILCRPCTVCSQHLLH